ncbi:HAT, C-terminal dimerisation domain [Cinara cedri]|uniref:HAT, C-terminal dimerisation domain n=1 Tax=Cinara cedri TaxID=506608 RepID=A0A5E4N094_9HEMI|nr:HAT, C-terminal dimerisation domain [Cinara cedri]
MATMDYFKNYFTVLQKFMVILVTSCTRERSFSKLSLVKLNLRTTTVQQRLNALMVLTVEQELTVDIDTVAVIEDFKSNVESKKECAELTLFAYPAVRTTSRTTYDGSRDTAEHSAEPP